MSEAFPGPQQGMNSLMDGQDHGAFVAPLPPVEQGAEPSQVVPPQRPLEAAHGQEVRYGTVTSSERRTLTPAQVAGINSAREQGKHLS